jgi:hypothetical protein
MDMWSKLYAEVHLRAASARAMGQYERERTMLDVMRIMDRLAENGEQE